MLFSLTAYARLGETEDQLVARFGQSSLKTNGPLGPYFEFTKTGFVIKISLVNNHSGWEIYEKNTGDAITNEEQKQLLEINSLDKKWALTSPSNAADKTWMKEDGSTAIRSDMGSSKIEFKSKECIDAEAAGYKKAHYSSTEGF